MLQWKFAVFEWFLFSEKSNVTFFWVVMIAYNKFCGNIDFTIQYYY